MVRDTLLKVLVGLPLSSAELKIYREAINPEIVYWAFLEPVHPQRYEGALDLIRPSPKLRLECKDQVILAVRMVDFCIDFEHDPSRISPANLKKQFTKRAEKLESAAAVIDDPEPKRRAAGFRMLAAGIPIRPGGKLQNDAKRTAVYGAHRLLKLYGDPPKLTRERKWQDLSRILYGIHREADLFQTMRDCHAEFKRWSQNEA
jgi:hypothetical protein